MGNDAELAKLCLIAADRIRRSNDDFPWTRLGEIQLICDHIEMIVSECGFLAPPLRVIGDHQKVEDLRIEWRNPEDADPLFWKSDLFTQAHTKLNRYIGQLSEEDFENIASTLVAWSAYLENRPAIAVPGATNLPAVEDQPRTPVQLNSSDPVALLTSWREITDALHLKHDEQGKVKSLNERYGGPIPKPPKGSQPVVEKLKLIGWWNSLDTLQQELSNQQEGKRLAAESSHLYGKDGEVIPELGGEVKKRRSDRQR